MIIFSPGPANISERVRRSLLLPDISHRGAEFTGLLAEARSLVLKVCLAGKNHKSVIFGGSGTLAIESLISGLGGWDKKILVVSNGVYGERAAQIARLYGVGVEEIRLKWGDLPDLKEVDERLKQRNIGALYIVHHETTTGLLNPLREVTRLAKEKDKLVFVDGVSSIAGEELKVDSWGIDAITGSANKCIRGVAGISFVIASDKYINLITSCKPKGYYANFLRHLSAQENGEPLFTPPVQVFYAFREALRELLDEGLQKRLNKYKAIVKLLRDGLRQMKLNFYLHESNMSNTMTAAYLPLGRNYNSLYKDCKNKGYVIYAGQGKLAKTIFRLGTVGKISQQDIRNFLKDLKAILRR